MDGTALSPILETSDVGLAARGDAQAFARLYEDHKDRIWALACRMTSPDRAAELTQDVFVRAWQKLGTFRGEAQFGTWLHRLAVNLILSRRATFAIERARFLDGEDSLDHLPARSSNSELGIDFESAIARLPDGARTVFVLHDIEGYRHEEIAGLLGVATGTTKAQLHRARMLLRRHLG
ncbi:MAG TPA: sigma-70 family RNA polymerase sigma factor [Candidatus Acidoferrales bacterium]|nr:sigma-70 family RNA polymerase sigma factor [Candidatus Acidoferrales bacterium]